MCSLSTEEDDQVYFWIFASWEDTFLATEFYGHPKVNLWLQLLSNFSKHSYAWPVLHDFRLFPCPSAGCKKSPHKAIGVNWERVASAIVVEDREVWATCSGSLLSGPVRIFDSAFTTSILWRIVPESTCHLVSVLEPRQCCIVPDAWSLCHLWSVLPSTRV